VTSINSKMGFKPAGKRARLKALSGVTCPTCKAPDVRPTTTTGREGVRRWFCAKCGEAWTPTEAEIAAYNDRVRGRDRIE